MAGGNNISKRNTCVGKVLTAQQGCPSIERQPTTEQGAALLKCRG